MKELRSPAETPIGKNNESPATNAGEIAPVVQNVITALALNRAPGEASGILTQPVLTVSNPELFNPFSVIGELT